MDWTWLIYIALFGAVIYFMMIRPSRKRADDQKKMMNAMQPGARVMLTSGIFGTIQAMGDQQAVIELSPGVAITVVKAAIAKVVADSEEEFEYTDEDGHLVVAHEPAAAIEPTDGAAVTLTGEADAIDEAANMIDTSAGETADEVVQEADEVVTPVVNATKARGTKKN